MTSPRKFPVNFLRLVEATPQPIPLNPGDLARPAWQSTLFGTEHPSLLVFVHFDRVSEADFLSLLTGCRPRYVIDLRRVPRFDVGGLNRRLVFSLFSQTSSQYVDLSGQLRITAERDARLNPALLVSDLQNAAFRTQKPTQGPIAFLVDAPQFEENYIELLAGSLPSFGRVGWDVLRLPQVTSTMQAPDGRRRDLVFISHANPEDNTFAVWLGTHLANAGYSVWTDVTRLLGGEQFWDTIEEAIRHSSSKVIVVLSHSAQMKQGVLDEINLAVSVERGLGLDRLVVPVRVDDLPFEDVRANLARKNIIDFRANWAAGLSHLLALFEQDDVPKANPNGASTIADWYTHHFRSEPVASIPELLASNWLPINDMPAHVLMQDFSVERNQIEGIAKKMGIPWFPFLRLIGTFAEAHELQARLGPSVTVTTRYRIPLDEFLAGQPPDLPGLIAREAHRLLIRMLRQAWDNKAAALGLLPYKAASGAVVWYIPKGLIEGDRAVFTDQYAGMRKKMLVGWSERRRVHWHFGIEAKPVIARIPRLIMRSHILFTTDGITPLSSTERMHALRRGFCKNWWNDRWRDLLAAFVAWLAGESNRIELPCGGTAKVTLAGSLLTMQSPVSIPGEATGPDELVIIDELDSEGDDYPDADLDECLGSG
jgi:hypothetical protein